MTQEAKELAERLRWATLDWDKRQKGEYEAPSFHLRCGSLLKAADALDRRKME